MEEKDETDGTSSKPLNQRKPLGKTEVIDSVDPLLNDFSKTQCSEYSEGKLLKDIFHSVDEGQQIDNISTQNPFTPESQKQIEVSDNSHEPRLEELHDDHEVAYPIKEDPTISDRDATSNKKGNFILSIYLMQQPFMKYI